MCVCVPERILRQAFLTFPCGSLNLICFSCLTQPPTVTATLALTATAASVRDVGIKKRCCVGVFAKRWV